MKAKGIRIEDESDGFLTVNLSDILQEIKNGTKFYWSILFMDVTGNLGEGISVPIFQEQINNSEKGFFINWEDLNALAKKFRQIIDITILGCKNEELIKRYEDEQDLYESCDIVIRMIDGYCWEIFSKDENLINRIASKFKKIEYIESDYLNVYLNRKSIGIKIEDSRNTGPCLSKILSEIDGEEYYWSIFSIEAKGVGQEQTILNIQQRAKEEHGYFMRWNDLKFFATKLSKIINITILGGRTAHSLEHYKNTQKQCESCEIVIKKIDNSYWEVFSKDTDLIHRLASKFQLAEYLNPEFT